MNRPDALSNFLSAVKQAVQASPPDEAKPVIQKIFDALETPGQVRSVRAEPPPGELADSLEHALRAASQETREVAGVAATFRGLAPMLRWARRPNSEQSPGFHDNHVNTAIVGPLGIEQRSDVIVGAGLLNPRTHYPIHSHPPEELYIVLTEGEWFRDERQWYPPGIGTIVHHPPGVTHGLRSLDAPLLAVWCLYVERQGLA